MIEHLDTNDGRYVTLINKINEIADAVNKMTVHYHEYLGVPEENNLTSFPMIGDKHEA